MMTMEEVEALELMMAAYTDEQKEQWMADNMENTAEVAAVEE